MTAEDTWACIKCNQQGKIGVPINFGLCHDHYFEMKETIEAQNAQIIQFDNDYTELLEEIVEDLEADMLIRGYTNLIDKYNKKLWSQKKRG